MKCYDCAVEGRSKLAVGSCVNCGAGVCRRHLQVGQQDIQHVSVGPQVEEATRRLLCTSCDEVLVNRQPEHATQKKRSLADLASSAVSALGTQGSAVAQRTSSGTRTPKTRQELYDEAQRRGLKGRSKMDRDELARALGHN